MVLRHRLPSPNALFVFEVAARLGSFSRAARELNITQPAVSHAIAALEERVGRKLFVRAGPKLRLTEFGERLGRVTTGAFDAIERSLSEEASGGGRETVRLSISSGMATHWLMPRYDEFRAAFPNTDLEFRLIAGSVGGPLGECDLGLRVASGEDSKRLGGWFAPERVLAAAAPDYLASHGPLDAPLATHTLVSLTEHWFDWPEFCSTGGLAMPSRVDRLAFSDYSVVLQAALRGQGVALAWTSVASRLLLDGLLVQAAPPVILTYRSYHLVHSDRGPLRPIVERVRDWLISEMQRDERRLARLFSDGGRAYAEAR